MYYITTGFFYLKCQEINKFMCLHTKNVKFQFKQLNQGQQGLRKCSSKQSSEIEKFCLAFLHLALSPRPSPSTALPGTWRPHTMAAILSPSSSLRFIAAPVSTHQLPPPRHMAPLHLHPIPLSFIANWSSSTSLHGAWILITPDTAHSLRSDI